ncbi:hypothetical protein Pan241w_38900 [Gimesia alba]|uniref:Uncharacterized protein n=1 Tax=Gimesia alba TaxID=2527973 RepID=A0A517RIT0_9PLAN|nr:hypothetical protein [Gimesia alba]QDT43786.1 hypothetical protein Pan241w_38900 [Gimesia alba]
MEETQDSDQTEAETSQEVTAASTLPPKPSLLKRRGLWFLAFLLAASAMIYQRATGPTHPMKFRVADGITAKLIRTHESTHDAVVELPVPENVSKGVSGTLFYKRFRTKDDFTPVLMELTDTDSGPQLQAPLPKQPAAGKLEYYIEAKIDGKQRRFPKDAASNVLIRFKDPVPDGVLIPHITLMIFSILLGMRSGLAALFAPYNMRQLAWVTLCGMTVGGMILGPMVQKYAFGEYWTGFPLGGDWTDNKMLFMFLAWVFACSVIGLNPYKKVTAIMRIAVFTATIVMTVCYLIPHSMGGSELDYSQVDQGIDPSEAIKTGRQ